MTGNRNMSKWTRPGRIDGRFFKSLPDDATSCVDAHTRCGHEQLGSRPLVWSSVGEIANQIPGSVRRRWHAAAKAMQICRRCVCLDTLGKNKCTGSLRCFDRHSRRRSQWTRITPSSQLSPDCACLAVLEIRCGSASCMPGDPQKPLRPQVAILTAGPTTPNSLTARPRRGVCRNAMKSLATRVIPIYGHDATAHGGRRSALETCKNQKKNPPNPKQPQGFFWPFPRPPSEISPPGVVSEFGGEHPFNSFLHVRNLSAACLKFC